jgi:hypothetical protein
MDSFELGDRSKALVPLAEAAAIMCFEVGMTGPYSLHNIDTMADTIAQLCTLYVASSADETMKAFQKDDLHGGRFIDGAKRMVFDDGRPALDHLVVTRTELRAALVVVQRLREGS